MANISGARGVAGLTAAQVIPDVDNKLYLLDSNKSPLTALSAKLRKVATKNPKFSWFEDVYGQYIDAINYSTGYSSSDTSMAVDNASYFSVGDVVKNAATSEVMRVTEVGTTTVAFARGQGETSAASVTDNDPLWIIGSAAMEGDDSEEANTTNASEVYNYAQIFRTPFEVTTTDANTELYTGRDLETQKMKKGIEHAEKIERAFLFGERGLVTTGTHNRRFTRGLQKFITTNVTDAGGTLTEAEFESFLESGMRYGSRTKYFFCSRKIASAINSWAQGKLQMFPSDKSYGIAITRYLSVHGEIRIIVHDMFAGTTGVQTGYSGWGFLVDMDNVVYRPQQNLDTKLHMNIQAPDEETVKGEYRTHVGLQLMQEKSHAILYDVVQY